MPRREQEAMFEQLPTPSVLVDSERLAGNIAAAQRRAHAARVSLRPHVKTHRSVEIARRQLAEGASGITCAKPSEAAVFVDAGFEDVRIAYPVVGSHRVLQVLALSQRATISFCVDSLDAARVVSGAFSLAGAVARVLLKIDCGYGRAGWRWDDRDLGALAQEIARLPAIEIVGVLTHAGQAYGSVAGGGGAVALGRHADHERDRTQQAAARVGEGLEVGDGTLEVSIGSTPTFWHFTPDPTARFPVTEVRPGNYVFHDLMQVDLGAASLEQCALSVLVTVVSVRERNGQLHALVDAGKKTLTSDKRPGHETYGAVLNSTGRDSSGEQRIAHGIAVHSLSEEHGWLSAPLEAGFLVGQRLRILVNHACVVVSTQRRLFEVEGTSVLGTVEVSARGCSL